MQQIPILAVALVLGAYCGSGSLLAAEKLPNEVASLLPNHLLSGPTPTVQSINQVRSTASTRPALMSGPTFDPALQKLKNERVTPGKRLKGHEFEFYR